MSLQVWLPLNGSAVNQGVAGFLPTAENVTYTGSGKVTSQCYTNGAVTMNSAQSAQVLNNTAITIAFWINPLSLSANSIIFGSDSNRQFSLFLYNGDATKHGTTLHWSWTATMGAGENYDETGNYINTNDYSTITDALPIGQWTHVCVTYHNPIMKVYINGILRAIRNGAVNYTFNQATPLINTSGNRYINDFRLYDHCLSPREVKLLALGLVAHYKLDKPTGKINYLKGANKYTMYNPLIRNANEVSHMYDSYTYHSTSDIQVIIPEAGDYTWILSSDGKPAGHAPGYITSTEKCFSMWLYDGTNHYVWSDYGTGEDEKHYGLMTNLPAGTYTVRTNLYASDNVNYTILFWNMKLIKGNYVPWDSWSPHPDDITVYDSSGYGNHGAESGVLETTTDSPRYSYSTVFDNNKYITIPARSYGGMANNYTFSYWGKTDAIDWSMAFVLNQSDGKNLNLYPKTKFNWNTFDDESNPFLDTNNNYIDHIPYEDGQWHCYTIVNDNNKAYLYLDGEYRGLAKGVSIANGTTLYLSGSPHGSIYAWQGNLSDFRLYATALSAAAVKELYLSSISFLDNGTLQCGEIVEKPTNIKYNQNGIVQAELISEIGYTNKMKTKTLSDGSAWARIHWLDVTNDATYFANEAEVLECIDKTNRFSMLKSINHFYTSCLPTEYLRLDYILPGGEYQQNSSYIDTGVIPDNNTKIVLSYVHNNGNEFGALFGARVATTNSVFGAWIGDSGGYYYPHWGSCSYNIRPISGITLTDQRIYVMDKNNHRVYGTGGEFIRLSTNSTVMKSTAHDAAIFNSTRTLSLFSMHAEDGYDLRRARGKLYFCLIYLSGLLIRDFIPCINTLGTIGLYDLVNHLFYTKHDVNSPNFIGGNVIDGHIECMLTYPKINVTRCNRWRLNSDINQSTVKDFFPMETTWPDRNGGLCFSPASESIYDCDAHVGNWYAPIGLVKQWTSTLAIPAADLSSTTETELWVRIDNLPKLTKLSMFNGALQAHQIYEL